MDYEDDGMTYDERLKGGRCVVVWCPNASAVGALECSDPDHGQEMALD